MSRWKTWRKFDLCMMLYFKVSVTSQVDATFYNGLVWMLENDITDVLENTFTDEHDVFGAVEQGLLVSFC
jgi:hypothetical protein